MKRNSLVKLGGLMMVALGALVPMEAKSFPFETTPEGFSNYLNSIETWEDGYKYEVVNPRDCSFDEFYRNEGWEIYKCRVDYKQFSTLGVRTCVNTFSEYWKSDKRKNGDGDIRADKKLIRALLTPECGDWEKVSATPKPPALTPQDPSQPQNPATTSTTLNNNLILAGCAGIFFAGGLLGIAFSQLLGRKKD